MNSDALAQHGQQMSDESSSKASGSRPKAASAAVAPPPSVIDVRVNKLYYGNFLAVRNTEIEVAKHEITAFIGPSGCGKSTVLRCLNRMNDFVPGFRLEGSVHYQGQDIYAPHIDPMISFQNGGYAVGGYGTEWRDVRPVRVAHVFDVATLTIVRKSWPLGLS